jgi:hypothetical protein
VSVDTFRQDNALPEFRVRLGVFLALLRVIAGYRGRSRVRWWAGGFEYDIRVRRRKHRPLLLDFDASGIGHEEALERIREHLSA